MNAGRGRPFSIPNDTRKGSSSSFGMSPASVRAAGRPGVAVAPGRKLHPGPHVKGSHLGAWDPSDLTEKV